MASEADMAKSRWWLAPDLAEALERGGTFADWLAGRIPVASYARISADITRDEHGVEDQHASNGRHAGKLGLAIVKYYEDNDKTAAKDEVIRDAFDLLVKEVNRRRTSEGFRVLGVTCTERERLYRRPGDYERIINALTVDDDGLLVEDGKHFDLYGDGAEVIGLVGVAQSMKEIRKIRQRTRRSHVSRAQRGKYTGGPRRFGWLGADKKAERPANMEKNPAEWPILKQMIRDGVAGKSWTTIASDLNERGIPTSKGGKWGQASVRALLTNPFICGYRRLNGDLVRDDEGNIKVGEWDAPATPAQWRAMCERSRQSGAQKGLTVDGLDHSPGGPSDRSRVYLFSGFLRCGNTLEDGTICNGRMGGTRRKNRDGTYGYHYRCVADGKGACGRISRKGEDVDRYLKELVLQKLEKQLKNRARRQIKPWDKEDELTRLETKAANLRQQWRDDVVTDDFFYAELPPLEGKLRKLRAEQERHALTEQQSQSLTVNIRNEWESMDLAQKRAAIGRVLRAVLVSPLEDGAWRRGPFDPTRLRPIWRGDDLH
ncbi:recombinase family protein [Spirillospora sp. NPDC048832]